MAVDKLFHRRVLLDSSRFFLAKLTIATSAQSTAAQTIYQVMRSAPVIATGIDSIQNASRLACINTPINKLPVCSYTHTISILKGGRNEKSITDKYNGNGTAPAASALPIKLESRCHNPHMIP